MFALPQASPVVRRRRLSSRRASSRLPCRQTCPWAAVVGSHQLHGQQAIPPLDGDGKLPARLVTCGATAGPYLQTDLARIF